MTLSVPSIVLTAKRLEIEELKRLQSRSYFVGVIAQMIHTLQAERGASSIFLASAGNRFEDTRRKLVADSESVERLLRKTIEEELRNCAACNAKIISLIAWVLVGLDALPDLRGRIDNQRLSGSESVAAFSRLIAGLISLIFEVTDAAVDPHISGLLVSLFNLVEAKELAGQERAVGALAFGSGSCASPLQERVLQLIELQERSIRLFLEFAEEPLRTKWHAMEKRSFFPRLQDLRQLIREASPDSRLDPSLSDTWFESCSDRITYMWSLQRDLVDALQQRCVALIAKAERDLTDSEGLLDSLRDAPPARTTAIDRFFDPDVPIERSLGFLPMDKEPDHQARSLIELLQVQSQRLADAERELVSAKQALNERKLIERAKGVVMASYRLSEGEAYRKMQKLSMDRNLRLVEVAELLLS